MDSFANATIRLVLRGPYERKHCRNELSEGPSTRNLSTNGMTDGPCISSFRNKLTDGPQVGIFREDALIEDPNTEMNLPEPIINLWTVQSIPTVLGQCRIVNPDLNSK